MKNHDYVAQLHDALLRASTSRAPNVRTAYFDLAEFYYRHVDASSRLQHGTGVLTELARECCHEQRCWCKKGHDHGK
jgi:hypothetical protein